VPIKLKVAKCGKSVTVSVERPPLYCEGGGVGGRQITKSATISRGGSFSATIIYEFPPTHSQLEAAHQGQVLGAQGER
jgi:hypothetical protein